jgi:drug/metabolite transporter (DMT)-like permease
MRQIAFLYAIGAAIFWGLTYTIDEKLLRSASPLALLAVHGAMNLGIALPLLLAFEERSALVGLVQDRSWLGLLIVAQLLGVAANYCIFAAIQGLGASTASIFEISYPLFVVLFSWLAYGSFPDARAWLGGALILGGSALIVFGESG